MNVRVTSFAQLAEQVDAHHGVLTVSMRTLRELYGADRLGTHVRANISSTLEKHGLRHRPDDLPDSQTAEVRVYRGGSQVGKLIFAVLNVGDENDEIIRRFASENALDVIEKIRELVEI